MFTKIVVAVDGSACSRRALEVAIALARSHQGSLFVSSVVDPLSIAALVPAGPALDIMLTDREIAARHLVDEAVEEAHRAGITARGETSLGIAFDEIARSASREDADVIVVGTHGRTGFKRFVLGSVAEHVLRQAPCPVIVVRDEGRGTSGSTDRDFAESLTAARL